MQFSRAAKENQPTICSRDSGPLAGGGEVPEAADVWNAGIWARSENWRTWRKGDVAVRGERDLGLERVCHVILSLGLYAVCSAIHYWITVQVLK